jgi:hypothetical protein
VVYRPPVRFQPPARAASFLPQHYNRYVRGAKMLGLEGQGRALKSRAIAPRVRGDIMAAGSALVPRFTSYATHLLAVTRYLESAAAIVESKSAVAGVPRWLRAYRDRASVHSCCRVVHPIPAHHHACGNAFFRSPPATCTACRTVSWPHSAGSTASDRYYVDDRLSSFGPRGTADRARSGSSIIVIGVCWPSVARQIC